MYESKNTFVIKSSRDLYIYLYTPKCLLCLPKYNTTFKLIQFLSHICESSSGFPTELVMFLKFTPSGDNQSSH